MSQHEARVTWRRDSDDFTYEAYTRDHSWTFPGGIDVAASAAPGFLGSEELVDPEEAFVASLSACHMLTLLAICAKKRWVVDSYVDEAVGTLEKNAEGKLAVTRVVLRPRIEFSGERVPDVAQIQHLHESAHKACFLANSVKTQITVD